MRIYSSIREMLSEEHRNLREMGIQVQSSGWQGREVKDNNDYEMKEIIGNCFSITDVSDINFIHQYAIDKLGVDYNKEWADAEIKERISDEGLNPGRAYLLRSDIWNVHLNEKEKFDYTYSERMKFAIGIVEHEIKKHPNTRRAVLPIFDGTSDMCNEAEDVRIPCSMFYQFFTRERNSRKYFDMIYVMRSCDFFTHFLNDVYLAIRLQYHMGHNLELIPGHFTMFISSFHAFKKDLERYKTY